MVLLTLGLMTIITSLIMLVVYGLIFVLAFFAAVFFVGVGVYGIATGIRWIVERIKKDD